MWVKIEGGAGARGASAAASVPRLSAEGALEQLSAEAVLTGGAERSPEDIVRAFVESTADLTPGEQAQLLGAVIEAQLSESAKRAPAPSPPTKRAPQPKLPGRLPQPARKPSAPGKPGALPKGSPTGGNDSAKAPAKRPSRFDVNDLWSFTKNVIDIAQPAATLVQQFAGGRGAGGPQVAAGPEPAAVMGAPDPSEPTAAPPGGGPVPGASSPYAPSPYAPFPHATPAFAQAPPASAFAPHYAFPYGLMPHGAGYPLPGYGLAPMAHATPDMFAAPSPLELLLQGLQHARFPAYSRPAPAPAGAAPGQSMGGPAPRAPAPALGAAALLSLLVSDPTFQRALQRAVVLGPATPPAVELPVPAPSGQASVVPLPMSDVLRAISGLAARATEELASEHTSSEFMLSESGDLLVDPADDQRRADLVTHYFRCHGEAVRSGYLPVATS